MPTKCKMILRVDLKHTPFQYLIETVSLLYINNTNKTPAIGDWMKNV